MKSKARIDDDELLEDLKRVNEEVEGTVTCKEYRKRGRFSDGTLSNRFGSWNAAKNEAGLETLKSDGYCPPDKLPDVRKRDKIRQIRDAVPCQSCGGNPSWAAMEFHHINEDEKEHAISRMVSEHRKWEDILGELEKCAPICSNCHREITAGVRERP